MAFVVVVVGVFKSVVESDALGPRVCQLSHGHHDSVASQQRWRAGVQRVRPLLQAAQRQSAHHHEERGHSDAQAQAQMQRRRRRRQQRQLVLVRFIVLNHHADIVAIAASCRRHAASPTAIGHGRHQRVEHRVGRHVLLLLLLLVLIVRCHSWPQQQRFNQVQ